MRKRKVWRWYVGNNKNLIGEDKKINGLNFVGESFLYEVIAVYIINLLEIYNFDMSNKI